jgi:phosphoenolpyruvate carboxylase
MARRKIPATMATQHPDNASSPYWLSDASESFEQFADKLSSHGTRVPFRFVGGHFITANKEIEEAYLNFFELGCEEYLWDWEGKTADANVVERLYEKYGEEFRNRPLGRDFTLSFRIPNIWKEAEYRLAHAFVSILSSNDFAHDNGFYEPPIAETYLPMTTEANQLAYVREKYEHIARSFQELKRTGPESIDVIPLVEEVGLMANADKIVGDYVRICREKNRKVSSYSDSDFRVWFARSDPAMNSGMVPSVVAVKAGMSRLAALSERTGVEFHPMIGVGCLPFRGGLSPDSVELFAKEYAGMRTVTIQSGFKYDYPKEKVIKAVAWLNADMNRKAVQYGDGVCGDAEKIIDLFTAPYKKTIESIGGDISAIAGHVPDRRERKLHIGIWGYARSVGRHKLPRAIKFTGALYSIGIPPELIGTGRGIEEARKSGLLETLEEIYVNIRTDLAQAGNYLNRENLERLAAAKPGYRQIEEDVRLVEEYIGQKLGPESAEQMIHRNITSNILLLFQKGGEISEDVVRAGEIRRSLG